MKRASLVLVQTGKEVMVAYAGFDDRAAQKAFQGVTSGDEVSIFRHLIPRKRRKIKAVAESVGQEEEDPSFSNEDKKAFFVRRKELFFLTREQQEELAAKLKISPEAVKDAKENELVDLIQAAETAPGLWDRVKGLFIKKK